MNNARYLRELDFARFFFYDNSGIYAAISKKGGGAVQGASSIRYRRAIPIFTPYKVTTKVLSIFFIFFLSYFRVPTRDNQVEPIGIIAARLLGGQTLLFRTAVHQSYGQFYSRRRIEQTDCNRTENSGG